MTSRDEHIRQVISEMSEIFTSIRVTWQAQVPNIHPDMTRAALPMLLTIMRQGPITATELSCILGHDKTMVSKLIAQLRNLDLIQAEVSEEDRRVAFLSGTPFAEERLQAVRDVIADGYRSRFEGWTDEEVAAFVNAVHRFNLVGRELTAQQDPAAS